MNNPLLVEQAHCVLIESMGLANRYFNTFFKEPELMCNQRGKIAGTAHLQKNVIKLNPELFEDNVDVFLSAVIPHEVAHIITYQLYGKVRPHGSQWQFIMKEVFELDPEVRHQMDVTKTQGKVFDYWCECGKVSLSIRRHNNVWRNKQQYQCRRCGKTLVQNSTNELTPLPN